MDHRQAQTEASSQASSEEELRSSYQTGVDGLLDIVDLAIATRLRACSPMMPLEEMVNVLGCSASEIHGVLCGARRPSARFIHDFCKAFGADANAILGHQASHLANRERNQVLLQLETRDLMNELGRRFGLPEIRRNGDVVNRESGRVTSNASLVKLAAKRGSTMARGSNIAGASIVSSSE